MTVFVAHAGTDSRAALRKALDAFDASIDWSRGVFLKPNIAFPVKERSGQITRHKVVRTSVELIRQKNPKAEIVIGEGTSAGSDPKENFRVSGFDALAKKLGVDLLDLNAVERVKIEWKYGILKLPKIVQDRVYINLPILKQSSAAGLSAAMKNQKGLLTPGMMKAFHRWGLHDPIASLNLVIQPALTILDCSRFFRGHLLMAADNTYESDSHVCRILGIQEPEYVQIARTLGVGKDGFEVRGAEAESIGARHLPVSREYRRFLRLRLWSNPKACSMCRFVVQDLIRLRGRKLGALLRSYNKLLNLSIRGCELVYGFDPVFRAQYGKVICIGDCTRKLAESQGFAHVEGCPPTSDRMLEVCYKIKK